MERLDVSAGSVEVAVRALRPDRAAGEEVRGAVADIVEAVRAGGDEALRRLTERLDGVVLADLAVPPAAMRRAQQAVPPPVRAALELAAANVRRVAEALLPQPALIELEQGQRIRLRPVPVDRAGVYVPGGRAAYPSSAVMTIVPAQVAGAGEIAVCSPPGPDGLPAPAMLAACALLGVEEVYAVGGAQAVAALALGTETIRRVDVVVGPGNAYVEEAKRGLFGEVGIESLAGPSELLVVADEQAPLEPLAGDLRAQAEHGAGARAALISADAAVLAGAEALLLELGAADEPIWLLRADRWSTAYELVNAYAPEHLQLAVADPEAALEQVRHAGAVFLGASSGAVFGDYVAGTNPVLPTGGSARFSTALSPASFLRMQEVVEVDAAAGAALAPAAAALAQAEGLPHHARSALARRAAARTADPAARG